MILLGSIKLLCNALDGLITDCDAASIVYDRSWVRYSLGDELKRTMGCPQSGEDFPKSTVYGL